MNDNQRRYYWNIEGQDPKAFLNDEINGLDGSRTWLLDVIPDGDSILDIGCGPGHVSKIFKNAGRNNSYIGVDNDNKIIEFARSLYPDELFQQHDAFFLPFGDNSVDHCILFSVVEAVADFRKVVEEAYRVAQKQVIIAMFIPLIQDRDYQAVAVNNIFYYCVRINEKKFMDHLESYGKPISFGTLTYESEISYWWWIIHKDGNGQK